jgi:hypothetical protein
MKKILFLSLSISFKIIGQSIIISPIGTNAVIEKTNGTAEQTIRGIASGSPASSGNSKLNLESNYIYDIFGAYSNSALNFNSQSGNEYNITNYTGYYPLDGTNSVLSIRKGSNNLATFDSYGLNMATNKGIGFGIEPIFPLTMGAAFGDKISFGGLFSSIFGTQAGPHNGVGLQNNLLQIFSKTNTDDIAFGFGQSNDFTELVRIRGNGRLGLGTPSPSATLDVRRGTAPDGTAIFRGTTNASHFNFATAEDTYIRGGKAGSKVLINDVAGLGSVGIGLSTPNEILDVNGRMRIRHNVNTSGLWFSNSTNSLSGADGAFYGMKLDTETGFYIGNAWRFWVNNLGNATITGLSGTGNRPVLADANGTLTAASSSQSVYIQASNFHALTGSTNLLRYQNSLTFTGVGTVIAPLNLPEGAKINQITTRVKDNLNTGFMIYSLETTNTNSNSASQLSSGGSTIAAMNASPINYASTNNLPLTTLGGNYYYITLAAYDNLGNLLTWGSGGAFEVIWVKIDYTY